MKTKEMHRREIVRLLGGLSATVAAVPLLGWGPENDASIYTRRVQVYDLRMEGWSTLGSGFLGYLTQPLLATDIRDFIELGLDYTQDPHGHEFTLTTAHLAKLLLGQSVSLFTTYQLDHRHEVRIRPSQRFGTRPPIEVEIDEAGRPVTND